MRMRKSCDKVVEYTANQAISWLSDFDLFLLDYLTQRSTDSGERFLPFRATRLYS